MKPGITAVCCALLFCATLHRGPAAYAQDSASTVLLDAYGQSDHGNCGSVAVTKLVLARYGIAPVSGPFARQGGPDGEGFSMRLVDGTIVKVSAKQMSTAKRQSGFDGDSGSDVLAAANALYAVMAVRRAGQSDGTQVSSRAFRHALKVLGHGGDAADADVLPSLLGFSGFAEPVPPQRIFATYLIGSGHHIAFVEKQTYDRYGRPGGVPVDAFNPEFGTSTMYRYALDSISSQIYRQCSDGGSTWTPETAVWRTCTSTEIVNLDRK